MNQHIASPARRRILAAGAGALGFSFAGHALGASHSVTLALLPNQAPVLARAGDELVLSGRLTDARGEAITGAAIGLTSTGRARTGVAGTPLTGTGAATVSDADGRFLFVTAVPAAAHLDVQVRTRSGHTTQQRIGLPGQASIAADRHAVMASVADADQGVWRASVGLSISA